MSHDDLRSVEAAAHAYEDALVAGDAAAATAFFEADAGVSRFAPDGVQLGVSALAAARSVQPSVVEPVWLLDEYRSISDDVVIHLAVLDRGGVAIKRTQVWRRGPDRWRIAHAHVSRSDEPVAVTR